MRLRSSPAAWLLLGFHYPVCTMNGVAAEIEPIVITATRSARSADDTLAAVTVITRQDIERRQARSVEDLLRGTPGLSLGNNGGTGKSTSVFLRGTESDHVLVLIDGVKIGSATLGSAAFQDIPVELIERIEIVRGPRSSLYGSEAIGGVIQIFTRKGAAGFKPFAAIGGGRYRSYSAAAGVSDGTARGSYSLSVEGIGTDGFNACDGKPSPGGAGCFTVEPDRDGYRRRAAALRGDYRFENGVAVDAHLLRAASDNEFDGGYVNASESVQQVLGGTLRYAPADLWQVTLAAGQSRDESDNFKDGAFQSRFDTERDSLSWQNDITLTDTQWLTLGVDYQDDRVDGTTTYAVSTRDNTGVFALYQAASGAHNAQLSVRRDDNAQFGNQTTGGLAWGYAFNDRLRLMVSYGTAFKAPTFNELYFPGYGNADLRPEESRSLEFGLAGSAGPGNWSVNVFETRVDDLIAFNAARFAPDNIAQARIRGMEAVFDTRWGDWDLASALTLLDPDNRSVDADDGNVLPRRARQALRFDADRSFGRLGLGATLLAAGRRYDDLANTRELDGYTTLDLRSEYRLARDWRLQARIENLFDRDYETAAFYNQPGRGLYLTLRYQPGNK